MSSAVFLTFGWAVWQVSQNLWMALASLVFCFGMYRLAHQYEADEARRRAEARAQVALLVAQGNELIGRIATVKGAMVDGEERDCAGWLKSASDWLIEHEPEETAIFVTPISHVTIRYVPDDHRNDVIATLKSRVERMAQILARMPR